MTHHIAPPVRGRIAAGAVVIDAPLLGEGEAIRRTLALWQRGSSARMLPNGAWLVLLPNPVMLRAERAPGLPVPVTDIDDESVIVWSGGPGRRLRLADLAEIDPVTWLEVSQLHIHLLSPLDTEVAPDTVPTASLHDPPQDLRGKLAIAPPTDRAARTVSELAAERGAATTATGTRAGTGRVPRSRGWAAQLVLRTPAAALVRRRHARYLRELTERFERRDWDEALRDAIALGGGPGGFPTVRLPRRRSGPLRPETQEAAPGGRLEYGDPVHQHLQRLYRTAATDLERSGRVQEAAFVLADLLAVPIEAVALLERHGLWSLAAELAEARNLDPALAVRLWWQAGDRDRAVAVARLRGGFAAAVDRLAKTDPAATRELRTAWVRDRLAAKDHIGAVDAAWPDPSLRPTVVGALQSGMALGGPSAAHLLAHLATGAQSESATMAAIALLEDTDPERHLARSRFLRTFAKLPADDAATDRRLASAGLRCLVRDRGLAPGEGDAGDVLRSLRQRADPVLAADAPTIPTAARTPSLDEPLTFSLAESGQLPVHDAVALANGVILVALGELGVRLLSYDGRVRNHWHVPAHQLAVADSGTSAVLIAHRGEVCAMQRLDLAARQVTPWISVRARMVLPSFDGGLLPIVDDDGLAFFDATASTPRVLWREMQGEGTILDIARSPAGLAALVALPGDSQEPRLQLWQWDLPSLMLRSRPAVSLENADQAVVLASARLFMTRTMDGQTTLHDLPGRTTPVTEGTGLLATSDVLATVAPTGGGTIVELDVTARRPAPIRAIIATVGADVGVREHAGTVTIWDATGRIAAVELAQRTVLANLRTML